MSLAFRLNQPWFCAGVCATNKLFEYAGKMCFDDAVFK